MKKLIISIALLCFGVAVLAQSPNLMSYQAIIRNASNQLIVNAPIGVRVSILQGSATGTVVFRETYNPNPTTNSNGLLGLNIGSGLSIIGSFAQVNWSQGPYFVQVEADPSGGTSYSISSVSQLLSVPYALHAKTADVPGLPGPQGPQGPIGLTGPAGSQGAPGPQGSTGPSGVGVTQTQVIGDSLFITLSNGLLFNAGHVRGLQGVPGSQGPIGLTGPAGSNGAVGPQGPIGLTGPQGVPGNDGAVGPQGPIGLTGPQGVPGNDGAVGPQGPIGLTGPQGVPGNDGAVGPQGPIGLTGPAGPQGPAGSNGAVGPQGPIGLTGPQGVPGNDGAVGPQGPIGLTGPQGPQGNEGPHGIQGPQGPAGNDGVSILQSNVLNDSLFITLSNGIVLNSGRVTEIRNPNLSNLHGEWNWSISDSIFLVPTGVNSMYLEIGGNFGGGGGIAWGSGGARAYGGSGGRGLKLKCLLINISEGDSIFMATTAGNGNSGTDCSVSCCGTGCHHGCTAANGQDGASISLFLNGTNILTINGGKGGNGGSYSSSGCGGNWGLPNGTNGADGNVLNKSNNLVVISSDNSGIGQSLKIEF